MNVQFRKALNLWYRIEDYMAVLMLLCMIFLVFLQVLFRYVIRVSPIGAEEMARYLMVWVGFLIAGIAVRTGEHIVIDIIPMFVRNGKVLNGLRFFLDLVMIIVVGVFFVLSIRYFTYSLSSGERSVALMFPMWLPTSAVFVGSFLMFIYAMGRLINHIKERLPWK